MSQRLYWWKGENDLTDSVAGNTAIWNQSPEAYSTGQVGQCFEMTTVAGNGSIIRFPNDGGYNFGSTGKFSIELYHNPTFWDTYFGLRYASGVYEHNVAGFNIRLHYGDSGIIITDSIGSQTYSESLTDGTWYKIKVTYDGTEENKWELYIDDSIKTPTARYNFSFPDDLTNIEFRATGNESCYWDEIQIFDDSVDNTITADFSMSQQVCRPDQTISFTDLSTGSLYSPDTWSWDFGDTQTSTSQNPTHSYSKPGKYTVTLIASWSDHSGTKTRTIVVDAVIYRYGTDDYYFGDIPAINYANQIGTQYLTEILQNPEYITINRDMPLTEITYEVNGIKSTPRNEIWTLWNTTFQRGNYLFTIIDHKKRMLLECFWPQWKERWQKEHGGIYSITMDIQSAFSWTPPLFAFYPFIDDNASGWGCHTQWYNNTLTQGTGGAISSNTLIFTEQATASNAAYSTGISWFQRKDNSSIGLVTQFRTGELTAGVTLDLIKITDGSSTIRIYAQLSGHEESSSCGFSSSSAGLSSSIGLSSSSSVGFSSSSSMLLSSSAGLSSSLGLSSSSSWGLSSSSGDISSSSMGLSSSVGLSSSSSLGLSSSSSCGLSSSLGLSSSSSEGLSSSQGLSSSIGLSSSSLNLSSSTAGLSSSSRNLSSSSSSSSSVGLSSSQGLSSSSSAGISSSLGLSSSSSAGLSSSSSAGISSSQGLSSSLGLSSSSSAGLSSSSMGISSSLGLSSSSRDLSSSSSVGISSSSSYGISSSQGISSSAGLSSQGSSYSSQSTSSSSTSQGFSSSSSVGVSSSSAGISSSSGEGSPKMTIGMEWIKSGYAGEYIYQDEINFESNGARAWYDVCGTFDNINNQFHLYICQSGDSSKSWSYTMDYLYGTTSLTSNENNCLISDTTPTYYPEDKTWTSVYLLNCSQPDVYINDALNANIKFAMIIDEFIPPTEFNWLRKLFHYWNKTGGDLPK